MNPLTIFLVLLGCISTFSFPTETKDVQPKMALIGEIGNKVYYFNSDLQNVSWMAAREICRSAGLEFGEYNSRTEYSFIQQRVGQIDLWVGGAMQDFEDYQSHKAFIWESGLPIGNDVNVIKTSVHWICLYYHTDHTYTDYCTTGSHKVLCQNRL